MDHEENFKGQPIAEKKVSRKSSVREKTSQGLTTYERRKALSDAGLYNHLTVSESEELLDISFNPRDEPFPIDYLLILSRLLTDHSLIQLQRISRYLLQIGRFNQFWKNLVTRRFGGGVAELHKNLNRYNWLMRSRYYLAVHDDLVNISQIASWAPIANPPRMSQNVGVDIASDSALKPNKKFYFINIPRPEKNLILSLLDTPATETIIEQLLKDDLIIRASFVDVDNFQYPELDQ